MEITSQQAEPQVAPDQSYSPYYRRKIHVRLDDELYRKLKTHTGSLGVTVQQFLEGLIRSSLANVK